MLPSTKGRNLPHCSVRRAERQRLSYLRIRLTSALLNSSRRIRRAATTTGMSIASSEAMMLKREVRSSGQSTTLYVDG